MALLTLLFLATCFLAYSNGANDNSKGVATLFGSGTTNYRVAIGWATGSTFLGSICSIFLAATLVSNFSGKGLVPDGVAAMPHFLLAVAIGAGVTVLWATLLGFPISTTHSLVGALTGAGFVAAGSALNIGLLGNRFFLPLLVSPFIAALLAALAYVALRTARIWTGVTKEWCVCIGGVEQPLSMAQTGEALAYTSAPQLGASVDSVANCEQRYSGRVFGINCQALLDGAHFASAGVVSFARGLNDTPKMVGLLMVIEALNIQLGMVAVALGIAAGGLINARKVAETISHRITKLNHGQGFTANLVTGLLVVAASRFGLPVSTTHVSVGSLFGIGLVTRNADGRVVGGILLSWLLTLPVSAVLGSAAYWIVSTYCMEP